MNNYFKNSSLALIAASAMLIGCSQEEVSQSEDFGRKALNINVVSQDFVSEDGSRAVTGVDEDRTSTFSNGDKMGLFVIDSEGNAIYDNVKFVFDGSKWAAESSSELYYWKNADYILYYPYDETLTGKGITKVDGIKNAFSNSNDFYNQGTADAYEKADLMMAVVEDAESENITFNITHQFSLIEIKVPVRKYVTTDGFHYSAPVIMSDETQIKVGDSDVTPYMAGKGTFRFIVPSGIDLALILNGTLFYDESETGNVPVNFGSDQAKQINLQANQCKVYNVTYDGVPDEEVTQRDLEVGDYYYSDGSIYPYGNQDGNDLKSPMKKGCIGVVFSTDVNEEDTPDWTHGYVVALTHTGGNKWGDYSATIEGNIIDGSSFVVSNPSETAIAARDALLGLKNGYSVTQELLTTWGDAATAAYDAVNYEKAAPAGVSSGWFLPSVGQMYSMFVELGELSLPDNNPQPLFYVVDQTHGDRDNQTINKIKTAAIEKIMERIKKVSDDQAVKEWDIYKQWKYRLSTESHKHNNNDASWMIDWINNWIRFYAFDKANTGVYVRPVLAF